MKKKKIKLSELKDSEINLSEKKMRSAVGGLKKGKTKVLMDGQSNSNFFDFIGADIRKR